MKLWLAIILTIIIILALLFLPEELIEPISSAIVIISTVWVYVDAKKIKASEYKSIFGLKSGAAAFFMFILWPITFPGYLGLRYKIKHGIAVKKAI